MQPTRIFVYGTLQFPRIAAAVAGRPLEGLAARLHGFARFRVAGEPYPGIVPRSGASVDGLVYEGVDGPALARMDAFEGCMYQREDVTVEKLADRTPVAAQAYVVRPRWRPALAGTDWDPGAFAREWHAAYLRECLDEGFEGSGT